MPELSANLVYLYIRGQILTQSPKKRQPKTAPSYDEAVLVTPRNDLPARFFAFFLAHHVLVEQVTRNQVDTCVDLTGDQ